MKCKECEIVLYQNARFCHKCGARVNGIDKTEMSFLESSFKVKSQKVSQDNSEWKKSEDVPFKLGYWTDFITYAFEISENKEFRSANFPKGIPADRNWHALRLGSAKGHIELSFNTKEKTLRAGLFVLDNPKLYQKLEILKPYIEMLFSNIEGEIRWDAVSKAANISIFKRNEDAKNGDRIAQAEWFMKCACLLKNVAVMVFDL